MTRPPDSSPIAPAPADAGDGQNNSAHRPSAGGGTTAGGAEAAPGAAATRPDGTTGSASGGTAEAARIATVGTAPDRRRRLLRAAGLAAAAAVVLVLAASLAARAYARQQWDEARSAAETALGPLDPGAYLRPAVPDRDNAALGFERVARAVAPGDIETIRALQALAYAPREEWPPAAEAAAALDAFAPALAELHAAGRARGFSLGLDYRLGWETRRPNLIVYTTAGRLLLAHGRWSLAHGDEAAAVASGRALAAAAGGLESEPPLVAKFMGGIVERQLHGLAAAALAEGAEAGTLEELRALLRGLPEPIGLREALAYDAAAMTRYIETRLAGEPRRPRIELCAGEAIARYAGLLRLSGGELVDAVREAEDIEAVRTESHPVRSLRRHSDRGAWWGVLCVEGSTFALPYLGMEYEAFQLRATESARRLAGSALALGLHARATGGYPPALDAVPGAAARAPLTGEAPDYRLLPAGAAALAYPAAAAAVAELSALHPRNQPRLAWELPPPGAAR